MLDILMISDTILGIIIGHPRIWFQYRINILNTLIARTRISINENATEVEMNYKQSDSDQVVTMKQRN